MLLEVHQDRAIVATATESEIIDAESAQVRSELTGARDHGATHHPQQGVSARPNTTQAKASCESLPRLPSERKAHCFQPPPQERRPSLIGRRHLWQALTKGLAWACGIETAIPSRMETETDREDTERRIGQYAREPAMRATGAPLTVWTPCRAARSGQLHDELLLVEADSIELQTCPVGKDGRKEGSETHEGNSRQWGMRRRGRPPLSFYHPSREVAAPHLDKNHFPVGASHRQRNLTHL
jgi:hypothetical protein